MENMIGGFRNRPSIAGMIVATAGVLAIGIALVVYKAQKDPGLVWNPKDDPYPYLKRPKNIKVGEKKEKDAEEYYDLLDILNGKYGDT